MNIIAEIGTSHEGSEEKARALVDAAIESGADTVKFQWVYASEILHPNTGLVKLPTGDIPLYERFRQLECPPSFYQKMQDYIHSKGKKFCCSPFGLQSLRELLEINPDYVKIASPELNHYKMLEALRDWRASQAWRGEKMVPVILSSGVSKLCDIERALEILGSDGVSLLHCITSYPAPESEYNLKLITNLKNIFGVETGLSDHSLDPVLVPVLSVLCGGTVIEKHITLSRKTDGLDDPVALEPEQFALMCHAVRQTQVLMEHCSGAGEDQATGEGISITGTYSLAGEVPAKACSGAEPSGAFGKSACGSPAVGSLASPVCGSPVASPSAWNAAIKQLAEAYPMEEITACLGDGVKKLAAAESANYGRTNRSLHFMTDLPAGHKITAADIFILRTEKILSPGLSPEYYDLLVGAVLTKDVAAGKGVDFEDVLAR